jgi:hypothetical protein
MSINEAQAFGKLAGNIDQSQIINKVLDNSAEGYLESSYIGGAYVLLPKSGNFKEIQSLANNIFSVSKIEDEAATIEVMNGSGVSGAAKELADSLESEGYEIGNIGNYSEVISETRIIDHTGLKTATIEALENEIGVKSQVDKTTSSGYDITIIVGKK